MKKLYFVLPVLLLTPVFVSCSEKPVPSTKISSIMETSSLSAGDSSSSSPLISSAAAKPAVSAPSSKNSVSPVSPVSSAKTASSKAVLPSRTVSRKSPSAAASSKPISAKIKKSSQSDYPPLTYPALVDYLPVDINELVTGASLIIDATVIQVMPYQKITYTPKDPGESEIYEKRGITSTQFNVRPIELQLNEAIKGSVSGDKIQMYLTPSQIDGSPNFKSGDRMIFMLCPYVLGGYVPSTVQESYFYIAADQKVYPALFNNETKRFSGENLNDFINEIKRLSTESNLNKGAS